MHAIPKVILFKKINNETMKRLHIFFTLPLYFLKFNNSEIRKKNNKCEGVSLPYSL